MDTFDLYSLEHYYNLGGYLLLTMLFLFLSSIFYRKLMIARVSAFMMLTLKIGEIAYRHIYLNESLVEMLPLHLCNIAFITAVFTMILKSFFFFEITYFWSIGAFFALLNPEVMLSFPNFWNISFFITHYYLFFTVAFCMMFWNFRPTKKGLIRAFTSLNLIFILVFFLNIRLGTNYMFVNYKPHFKSLIDYLGPWPYYILSFEVIGGSLFYLAYLPFKKKRPRFSTKF